MQQVRDIVITFEVYQTVTLETRPSTNTITRIATPQKMHQVLNVIYPVLTSFPLNDNYSSDEVRFTEDT